MSKNDNNDNNDEIREAISNILDENKAEDITEINIRHRVGYDAWFIIATALSGNHMKKLVQDLKLQLKILGLSIESVPSELDYESGWVILDYGLFVVHLFLSDIRFHYNLEEFWLDSKLSDKS